MRLAVIVVALAACSGGQELPAPRERPPASRAASGHPPRSPEQESELHFVGVIAPDASADITPHSPGVLAVVHVRVGDRVSAGEVLAELDPHPFAEELRTAVAGARRAWADVSKARVDVDDARRKLALEERAFKAGLSPASAIHEAQLGVKRARAAEQSARQDARMMRSRADAVRSHLARSRLIAPFDGAVAQRFCDPGTTVEPGTPIVRLVRRGDLHVRFAVPPRIARDLNPGTPVTLRVDTISLSVDAIVRHVSPALDSASELVLMEAEILSDSKTAAALRPGLAAEVRLDRAGGG